MATGAPNPAAPSMKAPKAERHQQHLQAAVGGNPSDRFLHDFELAGLDGDVVEKNCRQHDPGNLQQAKSDTVTKTRDRQNHRHLEKYDGDHCRSRRTRDGAPVRLDLQPNQQPEQHKNGQGCNQRREPPAAEGVIDLGPMHRAPSSQISSINDFLRVPSCPWCFRALCKHLETTKDTKNKRRKTTRSLTASLRAHPRTSGLAVQSMCTPAA